METLETDKFLENLKRIVSPLDGVLAAVSGGSDSTAMLILLAEAAKNLPFRLAAAIVNHSLREGVTAEIELARETAQQLGIRLFELTIPAEDAAVAAQRGSLQAWARDRRYALLLEKAKEFKASFIATGHTRDDQAETVLIRLLRGTGIDGLSGIPLTRALDDDVMLIRPMLHFDRSDLRKFLGERQVRYANDPSNENPRFLRVRVRNELLPLMNEMNPGTGAHLAALAADASALVTFFEKDFLKTGSLFQPLRLASGLRVFRKTFDKLPRALWPRLIRKAVERVQGHLLRVERVHWEILESYVARGKTTGRVSLPEGPSVYVDRGDLLLFPHEIPKKPSGFGRPTAVGAGVWKAVFTALGASAEIRARDASLIADLEIRTRRPGDRLFGASRKFKEVFLAGKVPRPYRDFVPLLVEDDLVISCPGLVPSRKPGVWVSWTLDETAPFLDLDFGIPPTD